MKTKLTRSITILLAFLVLMGSLSVGVSALDLSKKYEVSWDHILKDENGNAFTWYTGLTAANNPYGYAIDAHERSMHDYTVKRIGLTGTNNDWTYDQDFVYAFCIEHGASIPDATSYQGSSDTSHGDKWAKMSDNQHKLIQLALLYGYPNAGDLQTTSDANACYAATQLIVWQISLGFRTSATALNDKTTPMAGHSGTMTQQLIANAHLKRYYDAILTNMASHNIIPSFMGGAASSAPTYAMTYSGGQYSITLTDTNGVLGNFTGVSDGGLSAGLSGNSLILSSATPISGTVTVAMTRKLPKSTMTTGFLIWSVPGKEGDNQDMVTGVGADPVPAYVKISAQEQEQPKGTLRIRKVVSDGSSPAGFQFEVYRNGQELVGTYTTDAEGYIRLPDLVVGSYSVREINIPANYEVSGPNPVTLSVFEDETSGVTFTNVKKQGQITVIKTNADPLAGNYSLAYATFEILDSQGAVVDTVTTGSDGRATSKALPYGAYTVREKTAPQGYRRNPNSFPISLGSDSAEVVISEQPQPGRIK
jgi:uncharacterized surface anchored protein